MDNLPAQLNELATLMEQACALARPYDVKIQALEVAKADALASLNWQIECVKALVREYVLSEKRSVKTDTLTVSYVGKETWDNTHLRQFAKEHPAVLQCLRDSSYATFRYRNTPN
jgi:hypothetical protein